MTQQVKSQKNSKDIKQQLTPNSKENIEFRKRHGISLPLFNSLADKVIQCYG